MRDVVVVDSVRTGLAKSFRGTFNLTRPDDMVAHCIDSLLARNPKLDPAEVEDVIVGAAGQTGEQGGNLARLAVVLSNLPLTQPAPQSAEHVLQVSTRLPWLQPRLQAVTQT